MPQHTQPDILTSGQCRAPPIRQETYAVTYAARHIRTANAPCAATSSRGLRTHIPSGLESGGRGSNTLARPTRNPSHPIPGTQVG
ncbi:hypothetical protein THER5_0214 [Bifidobacterium thermacidophilum subsp. thermacidophilum]|uniref:Uncharacterized protein n=1 Tax=Bifidobacterium thermacidophilum subsp. thermacidophilum TaxID=79262 RepID=A0A087E2N9_9BIFI|nr:hypothetical protein THER5_0214 [Bifidobacterium thermacidophilum subsp. thermacidophilum]